MENIEKLDFISQGFDENGIAFVSYKKGDDGVFCVNRNMEKVSNEYEYIKHAGKDLYVFPDEFGSEAYFRYKDNEFKKASRTYAGFLSEFNDGIAVVQDDDGLLKGKEVSYYINKRFNRISTVYLYAEEFNELGIARVIDLEGRYFYINTEFERVSPYFKGVSLADMNGIVIAVDEIDGEEYESFYKLENDTFQRISDLYRKCWSFNGDVAVVKDASTEKWYIVNNKFEKVSEGYDNMSWFVGHPAVATAELNGEKIYLTNETGSQISNVDLYRSTFNLLEKEGYDSVIKTIGDSTLFDRAKKEDYQDLKVAIKDYLVHNVHRIGYSHKKRCFYVDTQRADIRGKTTRALVKWIDKESNLAPTRLRKYIRECKEKEESEENM